jgi:hypothetical protein
MDASSSDGPAWSGQFSYGEARSRVGGPTDLSRGTRTSRYVVTQFATELGSMRWDENGRGAISGAEKPDNPRRFGTSRYAPRRPQPNFKTGA